MSDSWQTPDWLFQELDAEFHFDIDLCATKENSKCGVSFCKDYLKDTMSTEGGTNSTFSYLVIVGDIKSAFMNPPYSNPKPFIEKAWEDSKHCKIVCLVKCDPSTKWWATFWEYNIKCIYCDCHPENESCKKCYGRHKYNGPKPGCEVRFFPKRIKFEPPDKKCKYCNEGKIIESEWVIKGQYFDFKYVRDDGDVDYHKYIYRTCGACKGTGKRRTSGPSFPSALIIMDRRGL